jgi:hypothetical protein
MTSKTSIQVWTLSALGLLAVLIVASSSTARAQTPKPGWASQTRYHNAETSVQRNIVAAASRGVGQSSGQSNTNGTWLTDAADGDGPRMRQAINHYQGWYWSNPRRVTLDQIRAQMIADFAGSGYDASRKLTLANQIIQKYNDAVRFGPVRIPTNDNDTLWFLGIRKQCLEWAMSTAISAGGGSRNYSAGAVTDPRAFRPGMGLYRQDKTHAMLILDIRWDSAGNPVEFKVAEANFGTGWINPSGQIPWQRVVGSRTGITYNPGVYKVVSY